MVWRSMPGEEVRILGAKLLPELLPVTDPAALARIQDAYESQILQADLAGLDLPPDPPWTCYIAGFGLEIVFNGMPMKIARWPNDGWATGLSLTGGTSGIEYPPPPVGSDRPATARWPSNPSDMWLQVFTTPYKIIFQKVTSVDTSGLLNSPPQSSEIEIEGAAPDCSDKCCRWRAMNLLEELDEPGEYYFDQAAQVLYFWPPQPVTESNPAFVSILREPLIHGINVSHVEFRGLTLEASRQNGVYLYVGEDNHVVECTFKNLLNEVAMEGAANSSVEDSTLHHIGSAIQFTEVTARDLQAVNNHIKHTGRGCSFPAVVVQGENNRIVQNRIHDVPSAAIQAGGRNHEIRLNEIFDVVTELDDLGAVYLSSTDQSGIEVGENCFHDIHHGSLVCPRKNDPDDWATFVTTVPRAAIYLDNCASQEMVVENVFRDVDDAVWLMGGYGNVISGNLFDGVNKPIKLYSRVGGNYGCAPPGGPQCPPLNNLIQDNGVCNGPSLLEWHFNQEQCLHPDPLVCPLSGGDCAICDENWATEATADPCIEDTMPPEACAAASVCGR